jgi:hypothetical protein
MSHLLTSIDKACIDIYQIRTVRNIDVLENNRCMNKIKYIRFLMICSRHEFEIFRERISNTRMLLFKHIGYLLW